MAKPYSFKLKHNQEGRIIGKTEKVSGKTVEWKYSYDKAGRLQEAHLDGRLICQCHYDKEGRRMQDYFPATAGSDYRDYRYTTDNRLQSAGNNTYTHGKNGFRMIWSSGGKYTLYEYAPDYRLLKMEMEGENHVFEFSHNNNGQREAKFFNDQMVEAYKWLDFVRLAGFHDGQNAFEFAYEDGARTPYAMRCDDGAIAHLFYDQVGSLRVVADTSGNVINEVLYDPFGGIIEDTNPDLSIPIGFAGGLHDRDLGFVRFGWRDYDTLTSRWTAPDLIGDDGGDNDWYGYCLDDPVNGVDPLGLFRFGKRKLDGLPWMGALSDAAGSILDKTNLELSHEHGFYEGKTGKSTGLFPSGNKKKENPNDYKLEKRHYDDKRMKRSQKSINPDTYNLCGIGGKKNNCQDYADKLRERYQLLWRGDRMR